MAKRTSNNLIHKDLLTLAAAGKPVTLADGEGLYFTVTAAGRARFFHKYRWEGRTVERWLPGDFPALKLSTARDLRDDDRKLLKLIPPVNPIARPVEQTVPTFAEWCKAHVDFLAPACPDGRVLWLRQMTGEDTEGASVGPIASKRIDDVDQDDVKAIMLPVWFAQPTTAKKLLGRVHRVLEHRQVNAHPESQRRNPADLKRVAAAIGRPLPLEPVHRPSLPYQEVPAFMAQLRQRRALSARCLELVILTGCRVGEITGLRWGEVNRARDVRTITIPAARMKAQKGKKKTGEAHVIPLTAAMLQVLRRAIPPGFTWADMDPAALVFPNRNRREFDARQLLSWVKRILTPKGAKESPITVHGFRRSLVNWGTANRGQSRELMVVCIAHAIGSQSDQAYLDDRWLSLRRPVMAEWGRYCSKPATAKVLPFRRAA